MESGIKANLSHGYSTHHADVRFSDSPAYAGTLFLMEAAKEYPGGRLVADASVHAEYTFGEGEIVTEIADFCEKSGLRMQVHVSETRQEHEACRSRRGMTPIQFFDKHGLFRVPTTAAHCVWLDEADFDILAGRGITVAHCPSSNMKLGSGRRADRENAQARREGEYRDGRGGQQQQPEWLGGSESGRHGPKGHRQAIRSSWGQASCWNSPAGTVPFPRAGQTAARSP